MRANRKMIEQLSVVGLLWMSLSTVQAVEMPKPVIYDPLDGSTKGTLKGALGAGSFTNDALHGQALFLNGPGSLSTNRISYAFDAYPANNPNSTIMMWVKPSFNWETNTSAQQWILMDNSTYLYVYRNANASGRAIEWGNWGIYGEAPTGTFTNWFHIACVFSNINVVGASGTRVTKMYINGVQRMTYNDTSTSRSPRTSWIVGANTFRTMDATVDEVLFFRDPLSAAFIADIFAKTKPGGRSFGESYGAHGLMISVH